MPSCRVGSPLPGAGSIARPDLPDPHSLLPGGLARVGRAHGSPEQWLLERPPHCLGAGLRPGRWRGWAPATTSCLQRGGGEPLGRGRVPAGSRQIPREGKKVSFDPLRVPRPDCPQERFSSFCSSPPLADRRAERAARSHPGGASAARPAQVADLSEPGQGSGEPKYR